MSPQRRTLVFRLGSACLVAAGLAVAGPGRAQRVSNPIARRGAAAAIMAGRFRDLRDGVAGGALPGLYTVVSVDKMNSTLQLRDAEGRTAAVYLDPDVFDVDSAKAGDQVEVDFKVPDSRNNRLEVGGIWLVDK